MTLKTNLIVPKHAKMSLKIGHFPDFFNQLLIKLPKLISENINQVLNNPNYLINQEVDYISIGQTKLDTIQLKNLLIALFKRLNSNGQISIVFHRQESDQKEIEHFDGWLHRNGFIRYNYGEIENNMRDKAVFAVLILVHQSYNPIFHARQMASMGKPEHALEILDTIPEGLIPDIETLAKLNVERQKFCLKWQQLILKEDDIAHALFFREHRCFAQVTALAPVLHEAYCVHAEFLKNMGRKDMALRVLRSIEYAHPNKSLRGYLNRLETHQTAIGANAEESRFPEWEDHRAIKRILVITHENSDYGMDTLYHGLCNLLGKQNVIEFPWKATLHGQCVDAANSYPCVFAYPGEKASVNQLVRELKAGLFDLVVYADVVGFKHRDEVRRLLSAAKDIPLILYDTWDDCYTPDEHICHYIGGRQFDVSFKREFLTGVKYKSGTLPLPFSYPEKFINKNQIQKKESFFWAGKNIYGLRPIYIPYLEKRFGIRLNQRFDQQTYQNRLRSSHIGLSICGCGFDTVRYWELPANGVMLLSERLPISIPQNFKDGESAVFFDDLKDLESKLDHYLRHLDEADRIAAAGHDHYLKHHTSTARARQFLGAVQTVLNRNHRLPNNNN